MRNQFFKINLGSYDEFDATLVQISSVAGTQRILSPNVHQIRQNSQKLCHHPGHGDLQKIGIEFNDTHTLSQISLFFGSASLTSLHSTNQKIKFIF